MCSASTSLQKRGGRIAMSSERDKKKLRREKGLSIVPDNDFGKIRDRRDFQPLELSLGPILPTPHRDFSFTGLTGWRYYPAANKEDRLGLGKSIPEKPSTEMVIPDSWIDKAVDVDSKVIDSTRIQLKGLKAWKMSNGPRLDLTNGPTKSTVIRGSKTEKTMAVLSSPNAIGISAESRCTILNPSVDGTSATASLTKASTTSLGSSKVPSAEIAGPGVLPKAELYALYGKRPRKIQLSGYHYLTWDNERYARDIKYTSAFVCPITKEIFLAGAYGDTFEIDGVICWYAKKILAEHAAAARALDCWNFRERRHRGKRMSHDEPYLQNHSPELPTNQIPDRITEFIEETRKAHKIIAAKQVFAPSTSKIPEQDGMWVTHTDSTWSHQMGGRGRNHDHTNAFRRQRGNIAIEHQNHSTSHLEEHQQEYRSYHSQIQKGGYSGGYSYNNFQYDSQQRPYNGYNENQRGYDHMWTMYDQKKHGANSYNQHDGWNSRGNGQDQYSDWGSEGGSQLERQNGNREGYARSYRHDRVGLTSSGGQSDDFPPEAYQNDRVDFEVGQCEEYANHERNTSVQESVPNKNLQRRGWIQQQDYSTQSRHHQPSGGGYDEE